MQSEGKQRKQMTFSDFERAINQGGANREDGVVVIMDGIIVPVIAVKQFDRALVDAGRSASSIDKKELSIIVADLDEDVELV